MSPLRRSTRTKYTPAASDTLMLSLAVPPAEDVRRVSPGSTAPFPFASRITCRSASAVSPVSDRCSGPPCDRYTR